VRRGVRLRRPLRLLARDVDRSKTLAELKDKDDPVRRVSAPSLFPRLLIVI
jgi:hypothetical protein